MPDGKYKVYGLLHEKILIEIPITKGGIAASAYPSL
jgi:hypothetical protein